MAEVFISGNIVAAEWDRSKKKLVFEFDGKTCEQEVPAEVAKAFDAAPEGEEFERVEFDFVGDGYWRDVPAKLTGHPDSWHPDESVGEAEVVGIEYSVKRLSADGGVKTAKFRGPVCGEVAGYGKLVSAVEKAIPDAQKADAEGRGEYGD